MTPEQELSHLKAATDRELCVYLATKIRRARRQRKESQAQLASRAGVALRTYKRLETHGAAQLETFLKVFAALDRSQYLHLLFPSEQQPSRPLSLAQKIDAIRARRE